jgi:hypothetical protein
MLHSILQNISTKRSFLKYKNAKTCNFKTHGVYPHNIFRLSFEREKKRNVSERREEVRSMILYHIELSVVST